MKKCKRCDNLVKEPYKICCYCFSGLQKPFPHQQRVIDLNPDRAILNHEMRTGKSLIAAYWLLHPSRNWNTFVVCPKQNKQDWIGICPQSTVYSKEEFKKYVGSINKPTAIVIDEAHYFASPLFLRQGGKKRSQLAEALYTLIRQNPQMHVLLLTATPVKNDAWSLHTLLCYIGVYYDWKEWRDQFFELKMMPFLHRPAYFPRKDWRSRLKPLIEKHTDIIALKDIVEYLPPAQTIVIPVKVPKYKRPVDRVVTWMDEHQWEQQGKAKVIAEMGFKKLIVVAHYTQQIDDIAKELGKEGKPVFVLDGRTKDADAVKRGAQEAEECYFIVQASMGFGFDGYMFGAIVFASMSHSCVHHTQMSGRARHLEHLQPVFLYYLIGGRWDRRIFDCVQSGQDFNPHKYGD